MFGVGFLFLGLCLLAEAIIGREVWRRRAWRAYLWPSIAFLMGVLMWPVMVFYTSSAIHMLAHSAWAQALMLAGGAQLGLVRGKLRSPMWELTLPLALLVSGFAFLIHEQNPWFFSRAAFLHHALGWTMLVGALITLGRAHAAALSGLQRGVRDDHDRHGHAALLRPERRAHLRPSVPARRRAMRSKALAAAVLVALALPTSALAHAVLLERVPTYGARLATAPRTVSLQFDQAVDAFSNSIDVRSATGKVVTAGATHTTDSGRKVGRSSPQAAEGRLHGALARDVERGSRRLGRVHVRGSRQAAAADRGVRRRRPDEVRVRRQVGLLRGAGAARGRARVQAARAARANAHRRSSGASTGSSGPGWSAASSSAPSGSSSGLPTRSSFRSTSWSTATCRRSPAARGSGPRSSR